ncbi:hypothetical protein A7982_13483 [Minicystis rosea]|nr:hypothetical protein A7982_13483 [Minicystis rosea]
MHARHLVAAAALGSAALLALACGDARLDAITMNQSASEATDVPTDTPIADLTDAERGAFCTWYGHQFWEDAPTTSRDVAADGTVSGYAGMGCSDGGACILNLSFEHCVDSLKAQACTATVAQLDTCLHTLFGDGSSGAGGGNGGCADAVTACAPFTGDADCLGTIVSVLPDDGNCRVRVQ